jgi:hypothetical protein
MTKAPTMKRRRDDGRREEMRLDRLAEQQPRTTAGTKRDGDVEREAARARVAAEAGERRREALAVDDHHREDRAALDRDLEHLALLAGEAEQRAGEDEVAGARDRQELGQPSTIPISAALTSRIGSKQFSLATQSGRC